MLKSNVQIVIVDPQKDFCKPNGSLYVNGADEDMKRLAVLIDRLGPRIEDIHVTLDSHHQLDIAHAMFWIETATGKAPAPFTQITHADLINGKFTTRYPVLMKPSADFIGALEYTKRLEDNGRYPLFVWPTHCDIGSDGFSIHEELYQSLVKWETENFAIVNKVSKGSNWKTEHYSAVLADVIDPLDPGTMLNVDLINILKTADTVIFAGEALSHCVLNTVTDIIDNFGDEHIKKCIFLEDCSSPVIGFEVVGQKFLDDMRKRGMQVMKSTDVI